MVAYPTIFVVSILFFFNFYFTIVLPLVTLYMVSTYAYVFISGVYQKATQERAQRKASMATINGPSKPNTDDFVDPSRREYDITVYGATGRVFLTFI